MATCSGDPQFLHVVEEWPCIPSAHAFARALCGPRLGHGAGLHGDGGEVVGPVGDPMRQAAGEQCDARGTQLRGLGGQPLGHLTVVDGLWGQVEV